MSVVDRVRLDALSRVKRGELSLSTASELMEVSLRQGLRLWKRFKATGASGLLHKLRGRASNRRLREDVCDRALKLHQERYADFGPTLACEKLASEHGLTLSPDTLTALLKARGLWQRKRRRGRHRRRRDRRSSFGSMLQMDGSHHDWFEGRCGTCVLMVIIDDATSQSMAWFYPAETTEAAFDLLGRWIKRHGLPRSLYVDRHSIYQQKDRVKESSTPDPLTQFGRAMKELGIELICAHSPQAKGRVERRNAVFQDRLVKEMRLRKIRDMSAANALLEHSFLADLNRRFAVKAADETDLHRSVPPGVVLTEVLCEQGERVVGQDWCVRWKSRWLQIGAEHESLRLPRRVVRIKSLADGTLLLEHQGRRLSFSELSAKPVAKRTKKPVVNNRRYVPPRNHPWKSEPAVGSRRPSVNPAPAAPPRGSLTEKKKAG